MTPAGAGAAGAPGGISLERVAKSFVSREGAQIPAVAEVSLAVAAGTISCLTGPTGCGKATILRLVAGLDVPDRGTIELAGPAAGERPLLPVGYLTQRHTLFPWLTTLENVALPLRVRGVAAAPARERCLPILEQLGLADAAGRYPYELSGGMQQRAAIGRLLASETRCWLLDEPFSALDERTRHRLQELLLELVPGRSLAVLFVTHAIDEAVFLADRVHVLSAGPARVVATFEPPPGRPRDRLSAEFAAVLEQIRMTLEEAIRCAP